MSGIRSALARACSFYGAMSAGSTKIENRGLAHAKSRKIKRKPA
jgi:hypothetical protein